MRFIADLQIHSRYSRATSNAMVLEELDRWADNKGILVMGTGDFTHPAWFGEIQEKLEPAEPGLFRLKDKYKLSPFSGQPAQTRFMLTAEVSGIYTRAGRLRRIHNLIFAPDLGTVEKINTQLGWIGNLKSDGRPILGLDSEELARIVFETNPEAVIVSAHAWTPWFSLFGSMSGFDSLEECYGKYTNKIFAIETGLSSDPAMNWRLSKLDHISIISNSDSHSLRRIGREANIFDIDLSYENIIEAIRSRDPKKFLMTIEYFPEEGKYHYDGHRKCGVVFTPEESKKHGNLCPKCGKPLTIGVMNRVEQLADRPADYKDPLRVPYKNLVTLDEIIAEALGLGVQSKRVVSKYEELVKALGGEFFILLDKSEEEIKSATEPVIAEAIKRMREGSLKIAPGYDGEYGQIQIFTEEERASLKTQSSLF